MDTKDAGRLGGEARKRALTPQRRMEIAKHAVAMREKRRRLLRNTKKGGRPKTKLKTI